MAGDFSDELGRLPQEEPPVRPAKLVRILKTGTLDEEPDSGPIGLLGWTAIPVFRDKMLHPWAVSYVHPTLGMPHGCMLIGAKIDLVACAWTLSLTPEDRELLQGMKISYGFVPNPGVQVTK